MLKHHPEQLRDFIDAWAILPGHRQYSHVSTAVGASGQAGTSYRSILLEPPTAAHESGAAPAAQQRSRSVCVHIPLGEGGVASVRVMPGAAAPIAERAAAAPPLTGEEALQRAQA